MIQEEQQERNLKTQTHRLIINEQTWQKGTNNFLGLTAVLFDGEEPIKKFTLTKTLSGRSITYAYDDLVEDTERRMWQEIAVGLYDFIHNKQ